MITETGKIVSIEPAHVWVETMQTSACQACSAKAGCGQGLLNKVFGGKRHFVKVSLEGFQEDVKLHDLVELQIDEHALVHGSFWVYCLPLLIMIAGAVAGQSMSPESGDLASVLGALVGLGLSAMILNLHAAYHANNPKYQPVLHKVIGSPGLDNQAISLQE